MIALTGNDWSVLAGVEPEHPPTVSVIVAHYDQQGELDRTLAALARQTHPAALTQVIVVDDGSPVAPLVPAGVLLLRQDDRGFRLAAARNLGASRATGEVLVFLDADTAPEPGYLAALTRLPALAPDVLAVGRRRHADFAGEPVDAPVEQAGPRHELPSPAWLSEAYARSGDLLQSDDRSYRYVIGAVMACSRTLYDATGGFDETFTTYGGEDWEWAHGAWSAGAAFAHVPTAVAWHDGPEWASRPPAAAAAPPPAAAPLATAGSAPVAPTAAPLAPAAADDGRLARKNAETLALALRIPVAGSRPPALRFDAPLPPSADAGGHAEAGAATVAGVATTSTPAGLATSGATAIAGPGAASRPARGRAVDTVVRVRAAGSLAALIVCVDTVLQALPSAVVEVPAPFEGALNGDARILGTAEAVTARLVVEVPYAARFVPDELARATARVTAEQLGSLELVAADSPAAASGAERVALISTQRSLAREARWGRRDLFPHRTAPTASRRITAEPDLAAYFGGWG